MRYMIVVRKGKIKDRFYCESENSARRVCGVIYKNYADRVELWKDSDLLDSWEG